MEVYPISDLMGIKLNGDMAIGLGGAGPSTGRLRTR